MLLHSMYRAQGVGMNFKSESRLCQSKILQEGAVPIEKIHNRKSWRGQTIFGGSDNFTTGKFLEFWDRGSSHLKLCGFEKSVINAQWVANFMAVKFLKLEVKI